MAKTSAPSVDCLIAVQKMLDASEPLASRGPGLNTEPKFPLNQRIDPIDQDSATLRYKATYALQVLGLLELRCEISLEVAARLMRVQRRVRTGANLASLVATAVVLGALAFGRPGVAIIAAILAILAIGIGMESECIIMTRKSVQFGPQAAHERLSQIVAQIQDCSDRAPDIVALRSGRDGTWWCDLQRRRALRQDHEGKHSANHGSRWTRLRRFANPSAAASLKSVGCLY
jgi:hypothetical protein